METFGDRKPEKNDQENNDVTKSVATCIAFIPGMNTPSISRCGSLQENDRFESSRSIPFVSILDSGGDTGGKGKMPVMYGYVDSRKVSVLRDSGCNTTIVKENLVDEKQLKNDTQCCILADGTVRRFPVACIQVDTPYYVGEVNALCMANPVYDLVIGNIQGARPADKPDPEWVTQKESKVVSQQVNAVETRAQSRDKSKTNPLQTPKFIKEFTKSDIITNQMTDESLVKSREKAETGEKTHYKNGGITWYVKEGNLLYRKFQAKVNDSTVVKQLVVPKEQRSAVLKLGNDSVLSGHMGMRRTKVKILSEFWWPGLDKDIRNYCRSCDVCQKTVAKGKVSSIPLGKMPIIDTPFSRVAVDLIGPIHPPTDDGNRFILTVIDYATRYPEAKALKKIDTETVAEALVEIYSRVGIPREILTDQGKQFTSDLMKEVGRLLTINQLTTTPYHPSCNGLVERFNGTLKTMLRRVSEEKPRQWDRYIPALLFAYRDSVQESTGFSPFQLLYGRHVIGPLSILKEL